jgi:predicted nuclease of restriction endonuclease-like (RecB) superfamily
VSKSLSYPGYAAFLSSLKERILRARTTAAQAVSRELILMYWDIGESIVTKKQAAGWGDAVVERLAADLRAEFPDMQGFSNENLWRMQKLYLIHTAPEFLSQLVTELASRTSSREFLPQPATAIRIDGKKLSQAVRQLKPGDPIPELLSHAVTQLIAGVPWGHHVNALAKVTDPAARIYYLQATARFGWSRDVLLNQIKAGAYERAVKEKKTHNFPLALPEHLAEQADEILKSRYNLEFLGVNKAIKELELEDRLIGHLQQFILELGYGFCFIGRQHRLALGRKEYFVDLLFYHRFLKALVAFDLKIGPFEPEHAGKMDFYLNLLNEKERAPDDQPSIGIILCAEKDDIEVEFALKTKNNPIGVAEYQLQGKLPPEYKGRLPSAKQLADAVRDIVPTRK